jgi:hypothetical protein
MIYNEEDERSLILALKRILEERIKEWGVEDIQGKW